VWRWQRRRQQCRLKNKISDTNLFVVVYNTTKIHNIIIRKWYRCVHYYYYYYYHHNMYYNPVAGWLIIYGRRWQCRRGWSTWLPDQSLAYSYTSLVVIYIYYIIIWIVARRAPPRNLVLSGGGGGVLIIVRITLYCTNNNNNNMCVSGVCDIIWRR